MLGKSSNQEPGHVSSSFPLPGHEEDILVAIALLLGLETDYQKRLQAAHYLTRVGPPILPLLVQRLHASPAIAPTAWPWWPPQYEHLGRLLIQLSQSAHLSLTELLHMSDPTQSPGPVLWTSVIEAVGLLPHMEYEPILRAGLAAPWWSVRYAAAMAIARRAAHILLCPELRLALDRCQHTDAEISVRLVASCALLRCGETSGLEGLLSCLERSSTAETHKATLFILATELPVPLSSQQKQRLTKLLLGPLQDANQQIALYAARALRSVADATILPTLDTLLDHPCGQRQVAALIALEELASRKPMRYAIQQRLIPQHIASLLHTQEPEIRRQACYTLAMLGGEYATAVLGTLILDDLHPAHLTAIEALRLLPEAHHPAVLARLLRWLLYALTLPGEMALLCALDSLRAIAWQARTRHQRRLLSTMSNEFLQSGCLAALLANASVRVRQRALELLSLVDPQFVYQRASLLFMLHADSDADIRAAIASSLGRANALWAVPALLQALLDDDESVAVHALHALATLPLRDHTRLIYEYVLKELAFYHLPLWTLHERKHLAQTARLWLKKQKNSTL